MTLEHGTIIAIKKVYYIHDFVKRWCVTEEGKRVTQLAIMYALVLLETGEFVPQQNEVGAHIQVMNHVQNVIETSGLPGDVEARFHKLSSMDKNLGGLSIFCEYFSAKNRELVKYIEKSLRKGGFYDFELISSNKNLVRVFMLYSDATNVKMVDNLLERFDRSLVGKVKVPYDLRTASKEEMDQIT